MALTDDDLTAIEADHPVDIPCPLCADGAPPHCGRDHDYGHGPCSVPALIAELRAARAQVERMRGALEHARHVLYQIWNERRTDDAHKINAHVESVRISSVLHGLDPDAALADAEAPEGEGE
jgi:hypothetical protein